MRLHLATFLDLEKYGGPLQTVICEACLTSPSSVLTEENRTCRPARPQPACLQYCESFARYNNTSRGRDESLIVQDIYLDERVTKSHVYRLTITSGNPSIFNAIDKHEHRVKRRLIGQAVNDKAMREFEPTMMEQIDIFIDQLRASSEHRTPVNMTDSCKRLGLDIVALLAFGYPLHLQTDSKYRFLIRGLHVGGYQNHCFMQFPPLKKLRLHHFLLLAGYSQRKKYIRMLQLMISSRLSEDKHAKHDLYSFVVDQLDNTADSITTSQLWSEALFFFPAGECIAYF